MAKKLVFRGKTAEEISAMSRDDVIKLLPSRSRRTVKRAAIRHRKLMQKIAKFKLKNEKKAIKTHCRDVVIMPEMIGMNFEVHNGRKFIPVQPTVEMVGLRLGDFANPNTHGSHSGPGIGATRGSRHVELK